MTNLLIKLLTGLNEDKNQAKAKVQAEQATVCNYSDNYYGDQVCTPRK